MELSRRLLVGSQIRLTALNPTDTAQIAHWYHDSEFHRLFDGTPFRPRPVQHWERWLDERNQDKNVFIFAIRPIESDKLLGWLELDDIQWTHRTAWIGLGIGDPAQRGKGYGSEAMRLILNFAFDELNLYRVQLTAFSYNTRALALYERLGFTREGAFRQALERDGQRHDLILFGILAPEWRHQPGNNA